MKNNTDVQNNYINESIQIGVTGPGNKRLVEIFYSRDGDPERMSEFDDRGNLNIHGPKVYKLSDFVSPIGEPMNERRSRAHDLQKRVIKFLEILEERRVNNKQEYE